MKQSSYQPGHAIYVITGKDGEEIRRERLSIGYKAYKKTSSGTINGFVTCAHGVYEAISSNIYIGTDFDEDDIIGTVYENGFTVSYGNLNKHDYSFIKLVQGVAINHIDPASTNSNQSTIATIVQGMKVYKTGSSTATTSSTIALVNFSISYPDYPGFVMVHLAKTSSRFATQGDSGGLVYTDNLNVAGIISGGSTTATLFLRASEIKSSHNIYPL